MWPRQAAELWPQLEAAADRHGLLLGSPSASGCGGPSCLYHSEFDWHAASAPHHIIGDSLFDRMARRLAYMSFLLVCVLLRLHSADLYRNMRRETLP